jgi:hypothetical protein
MSERIYATEITSEGNTMCVRVTAQMLDARINLGVVVETQNAEPRQVKGLASTGGATAPCENSLAGDFMRYGPSPSGGGLVRREAAGLI